MGDVFKALGEVFDMIVDAVRSDVPPEEIRQRLAEPGGVGEKLIAAVRQRRSKFDDFINNG